MSLTKVTAWILRVCGLASVAQEEQRAPCFPTASCGQCDGRAFVVYFSQVSFVFDAPPPLRSGTIFSCLFSPLFEVAVISSSAIYLERGRFTVFCRLFTVWFLFVDCACVFALRNIPLFPPFVVGSTFVDLHRMSNAGTPVSKVFFFFRFSWCLCSRSGK